MKQGKMWSSSTIRLAVLLGVLLFSMTLVSQVSAEGAWVGPWDVLSDDNSNVSCPTDLAVDSNQTVYVVDCGFNLVMKKEKTTTAWSFLPNQPYNGTFHYLVDVTVDSANNVYVLDGYSGNIGVLWK